MVAVLVIASVIFSLLYIVLWDMQRRTEGVCTPENGKNDAVKREMYIDEFNNLHEMTEGVTYDAA